MGRYVVIAIAAGALLPSAAWTAAPNGACDAPAPAQVRDSAATDAAKARKPANAPKPATPRRYVLM